MPTSSSVKFGGLFVILAAASICSTVSADTKQDGQPTAPPAVLDLGGYDVLTIHASVGGLTPEQRVDQLEERLDPILGTPNLQPDDVRIYAPDAGFPSIYVLGRRIVTVDAKTAKGEQASDPLTLAKRWAAKLQQVLPKVNWRPNDEAEPVVPMNPPLIVTDDLNQAGGDVGAVEIGRQIVMKIRSASPDGHTAAERADMVRSRIFVALKNTQIASQPLTPMVVDASASGNQANPPTAPAPNGPQIIAQLAPSKNTVADPYADAQIVVNGTCVYTVTLDEATAAGMKTPLALAQSWAKNITNALMANQQLPVPTAPAVAPAPPSASPLDATGSPLPDSAPTPTNAQIGVTK